MDASESPVLIHRFPENPLIVPGDVPWLRYYPKPWRAVFNCGVVHDQRTNTFKMLFRGGLRLFAHFGYAESPDGIHDWHIDPHPVLRFHDDWFAHGHSTTGLEDPRIVLRSDGWYYIFATACSPLYHFSGGKFGRLGIWRTKDLHSFEWVCSPFYGEGKNAAILSEPTNGYTYLIYRREPNILIARTKDDTLRTGWSNQQTILTPGMVFTRNSSVASKIGLAGPPVKGDRGWFVPFHAKFGHGLRHGFEYCLGFMVLGLIEPSLVTYVHPSPILWPERPEEQDGLIPNVCFSCATVDLPGKLRFYWGASDTCVCGGEIPKSELPQCYVRGKKNAPM
jgi:predicted GH43/DUF377 family glycosyl hydrolase